MGPTRSRWTLSPCTSPLTHASSKLNQENIQDGPGKQTQKMHQEKNGPSGGGGYKSPSDMRTNSGERPWVAMVASWGHMESHGVSMARRIIGWPADLLNLPWVLFWGPGVVKIGFLAKKYSNLTRFHNFLIDFKANQIFKSHDFQKIGQKL